MQPLPAMPQYILGFQKICSLWFYIFPQDHEFLLINLFLNSLYILKKIIFSGLLLSLFIAVGCFFFFCERERKLLKNKLVTIPISTSSHTLIAECSIKAPSTGDKGRVRFKLNILVVTVMYCAICHSK